MTRYGLSRRAFLGLATLPALVHTASVHAVPASNEKSFVFVPQAMPASLDPIATPSFATRTASMAVFQTLYGTDPGLNAMPRMVEAQMRDTWIDTTDLGAGRAIAAKMQSRVFTTAVFVPLGQWYPKPGYPTSAWRTDLTGQQKGSFPVFWEIARH
jgi:hypothetical protein